MVTNDAGRKAAQDDPLALRPLRPPAAREARCARGHQHRWGDMPNLNDYRPTEAREEGPASRKQLKEFASYGFEVLRPLKWGEARHLIRQIRRLREQYAAIPTPYQEAELRRQGRWRDGMTRQEAAKEQWEAACESFAEAQRAALAKRGGPPPAA